MTATNAGPIEIAGPPAQTKAIATAQDLLDGEVDYMAEVRRVEKMTKAIHELMRSVMKQGTHYGVIPGTEKTDPKTGEDISKPTIYQPGVDLLCMVFRLRPEYEETMSVERDDFIAKTIRCRLIHIPTGACFAEGIGSSNSREAKYASQTNIKVCPKCNAKTIFKSKQDGGWFCWRSKGGCAEQFKADDPAIIDQNVAADTSGVWTNHNTIIKLGNKRAKASAVMTATGAGSVFDIDLDDDVTPNADQVMAPAQWNLILNQQKRLGINGKDFQSRFIVELCGKEKIGELTFADAVAILAEMEKAPASKKPANLDEAAARSKASREGSAAVANTAKPGPSEADKKAAEEKAFGAGKPAATEAARVSPATGNVMSTRGQQKEIAELLVDRAMGAHEVVEKYGVASTSALTLAAADEAIAWLKTIAVTPEPGSDG